jgi:Aspartyl/Asparaginyl beta-hydroxylase
VLRLHLPLETNPQCAIRVGDETRVWQEGRTLIFCDAIEHEAWNRGTTTRTILLLDFKNPNYRVGLLNPNFSAEFVDFVDNVRWPQMNWRERWSWRFWKLTHFGRKPTNRCAPQRDRRVAAIQWSCFP